MRSRIGVVTGLTVMAIGLAIAPAGLAKPPDLEMYTVRGAPEAISEGAEAWS